MYDASDADMTPPGEMEPPGRKRSPATHPLRVALALCALWLGLSSLAWATDAPATPAILGKSAPDFVLRPLQDTGRNFRLSEHRGEVVVVGFWTSWCGACRRYLADLDHLATTYRGAGLIVVGVSIDDDAGAAAELVRALGLKFPNVRDSTKTLGRRYAVDDVPLTCLIDRDGVVRFVHPSPEGAASARINAELRTLLDE